MTLTIRLILWIGLFIPRLALYILRNTRRVLLLVMGGFFVFTGVILNLTFLGAFCGWPLMLIGLVLIALGLL